MYFVIKLCSLNSFGVPYFVPFSPISKIGLKDSIIKYPTFELVNRSPFLSKNLIKLKNRKDDSI